MDNYKIDHELNQYDHVEETEFTSLMTKFMGAIGMTTGKSEKSVKWFGFDAKGNDAMEVVDEYEIIENGEGGGPEPEPTPEPLESGATEQQILDDLSEASGSSVVITVPEGEEIRNLQIPNTVTASPKITGDIADGATVYYDAPSSSKFLSITNTTEEPVDINVGNSVGTVYLAGEYDDVSLSGKNISASSGIYAQIHGDVNASSEYSAVSITASFVGNEEQTISYEGENLTISNINSPDAKLNVNAPNATVTMRALTMKLP